MADAHGSGPCEHCAHEGSSPFSCTIILNLRKCRNWQTSKTKDLVVVTPCGFKSHLPHFLCPETLDFSGFAEQNGLNAEFNGQ